MGLMKPKPPIFALASAPLKKIGTGLTWTFTMRYIRGEIVQVLFPDADLRSTKRRPALIVQAENLNMGLAQVIVAMIASNISRAGHPSRGFAALTAASKRQTGLVSDSVIVTDNLTTVVKSEISHTLGFWPDMVAVEDVLRHTFGLS